MLHRITPSHALPPTNRASIQADFLLVCEAHSTTLTDGRWHFSIEAADGSPVFEAGDEEFGDLNRLTLLAAVRGLEAVDGPASVKLLSNNRYLIRSLSDSLPRWRRTGFVWEHFGRRIDIQHADLWRRVDRALSIHRVEACLVSSRLVSSGSLTSDSVQPERKAAAISSDRSVAAADRTPAVNRIAGNQAASGAFLRVDSAHSTVPKQKSTAASSDRLRRWLLAGNSPALHAPPPETVATNDLIETI